MRLFFLFFFLILSVHGLYAQDDATLQYIETYKQMAMDEQRTFKIPACITLAQGILESASGTSELAVQAYNHFGIKCKKEWTGETFLHDDDRRQECFRKYSNPAESYRDHSLFLRDRPWYKDLFTLEITDYKGWALGLKKAGYATNPSYAPRLIELIEKYNLQNYTYEALSDHLTGVATKETSKEITQATESLNPHEHMNRYKGIPGFWAKKGEHLLAKAMEYNIRYARLLDINDLRDEPLPYDMFVFVKRKNKIGIEQFHRVEEDENLQMISQREGILLSKLYELNHLKEGDEPAPGEVLFLQNKNPRIPKLLYDHTPRVVRNFNTEEPGKKASEPKEPNKPTVVEIKKIVQEPEPPSVKIQSPVQKSEMNEEPKEELRNTENLSSAENIVREEPAQQVIKVEKNPEILDVQKAQRTAELLGEEIEISREVPTDKGTTIVEPPKEKEIVESTPVPVHLKPKEETIISDTSDVPPTEKVNEKEDENVSEDVKELKKRFDNVIYKKR